MKIRMLRRSYISTPENTFVDVEVIKETSVGYRVISPDGKIRTMKRETIGVINQRLYGVHLYTFDLTRTVI